MSDSNLLQEVLSAAATTSTIIHALHSQPDIHDVRVVCYDAVQPLGRYVPGDGTRGHIEVSLYGPHPRLTFAHEAGHLLDQAAIGYTGYASAMPYSVLRDVMNVIRETEAYNRLEAVRNASVVTVPDELARRRADYWLTPQELWARAYAQFVAARSGDAVLQAEVKRAQILEAHAAGPYAQWEAADFAFVAETIDAALQGLGWR